MKKLLFTGISIAFLLTGCQEKEPAAVNSNMPKLYFDVPEFMASEITKLNTEKPKIRKTSVIKRENPEVKILKPGDWNEELSYFKEIDLNKKALQGAYQVSEITTANSKITSYKLKPEIDSPISLLQITHNMAGQVIGLKAISEEKNALFYNREQREIYLNNGQQLQQYRISGVQKVLLFDSLRYNSSAKRI